MSPEPEATSTPNPQLPIPPTSATTGSRFPVSGPGRSVEPGALDTESRVPRPESRVWRTLVSPPASGVENMAVDEALLNRARRTGECVLRVYTWATPTLSLGRNQSAREACDPARAHELGVAVVRRLTGGRALLHHREITYSVTAPLARDESPRAWYASITSLLVHALQSLGVDATVAPRSARMPAPAGAPCFELPAEGEIMVRGRKLVGSALVRDNGALLQHGSILVEDDQPLLTRLTATPGATPRPAATLREALGRRPDIPEIATAVFEALRARVDRESLPLILGEDLHDDLAAARARYASDTWTWRR